MAIFLPVVKDNDFQSSMAIYVICGHLQFEIPDLHSRNKEINVEASNF